MRQTTPASEGAKFGRPNNCKSRVYRTLRFTVKGARGTALTIWMCAAAISTDPTDKFRLQGHRLRQGLQLTQASPLVNHFISLLGIERILYQHSHRPHHIKPNHAACHDERRQPRRGHSRQLGRGRAGTSGKQVFFGREHQGRGTTGFLGSVSSQYC